MTMSQNNNGRIGSAGEQGSEDPRVSGATVGRDLAFGPTDRRAEAAPSLSEATRERIRTLAATYPQRRTALLPALKLAQNEVGYLPAGVVAQVADEVGVPHAAAAEIVAFYTMLLPEQEGAIRVVVCGQLPCALRGAGRLLRDLSTGLGLRPGETAHDGSITLERTSECFGACHRAPMARVNDDYYENLDPEATQRLIDELRARPWTASKRLP
jgi:NADH-quinone oxidoreductase subunit E